MKYILIITLIIISNITNARNVPIKPKQKWARIGLITSSIVLNAIGDGLYDDGHKLVAKSFRVASIGSLLAIPVVAGPIGKKKAFKYVLSYGLMRFALFDITYNTTKRLPLNYVSCLALEWVGIAVPRPTPI